MEKPSAIWYLLPIILGPIGGIIGYFVMKDKDRKFAERLLKIGLVMIIFYAILIVLIVFLALYAMGIFSVRSSIG